MKEVKILSVLLLALLGAAYWSSSQDGQARSSERVTIFEIDKGAVTGLQLVTRTQTVSVSFREDAEKQSYPWFRVETKTSTRGFVGNDKTEKLIKKFAQLEAIRSLGSSFDADALKKLNLDSPLRRLAISTKSERRQFALGGRTHGARDHYIRSDGSREVFLVKKKTISDLESPESQFMQRKVVELAMEDLAAVVISAQGKTKRVLRQNRLSAKDAFWASEKLPQERDETLGNFVDKALRLTARKYGSKESPLDGGKLILTLKLQAEADRALETLVLFKHDEKRLSYSVRSRSTHVRAEVSRSVAEQLERDLEAVLEDR